MKNINIDSDQDFLKFLGFSSPHLFRTIKRHIFSLETQPFVFPNLFMPLALGLLPSQFYSQGSSVVNVSAGQYLSFYAFFINIHLLNGSISKYMMLYWLPVFSLALGYQTGAKNTKQPINRKTNIKYTSVTVTFTQVRQFLTGLHHNSEQSLPPRQLDQHTEPGTTSPHCGWFFNVPKNVSVQGL